MKSEYAANQALGLAILNTGTDSYAGYNARRETSRTLRAPITDQPTRDAVPMAVKTLQNIRNDGELLHHFAVAKVERPESCVSQLKEHIRTAIAAELEGANL